MPIHNKRLVKVMGDNPKIDCIAGTKLMTTRNKTEINKIQGASLFL